MRYIGKCRFIGTDGSMGLRKEKTYILEVEGNAVIVYSAADRYKKPFTKVPYTVEGFLSNWREADLYDY